MLVRRINLAVAAVILVVGGIWVSNSFAGADDSSVSIVKDLPPEKAAWEIAQARLDAENAAIAADPERLAQVAADKAADDKAHRAELARLEPEHSYGDWPKGIFEQPEAPASSLDFRGTNRWVGTVDGHTVAVYAGVAGSAAGDAADTGRVLILRPGPADAPTEARGGYVDLPGAGTLRVVAFDEVPILTIRDSNGSDHYLDVSSGTWIQ